MYQIDIFSDTSLATVQDTLSTPDITVKGWTDMINGPGKLVFSMHKFNASATAENLRMWKPVRFYRWDEEFIAIWYGFIMAKNKVGDQIEVLCHGGLRVLSRRVINSGGSQTFTGPGSAAMFDVLDTTNSDDGDSGIVEGAGDVSTTLNITLNGVDLLRVAEEIAGATGAEFRVNPDAELDFVQSLGTDKSEVLEFIYQQNGDPSNLLDIEIGEDGEPMANRIYGTSTEGGTLQSTYTHPTSSTYYPRLIEVKAFNQANDQATLDALTETYGKQRGLPIPDLKAMPAGDAAAAGGGKGIERQFDHRYS